MILSIRSFFTKLFRIEKRVCTSDFIIYYIKFSAIYVTKIDRSKIALNWKVIIALIFNHSCLCGFETQKQNNDIGNRYSSNALLNS